MPKRQISVFIASPGDLASERKAFRETIAELNKGFGDGAGVEFCPYGWEDENAETGRRVQGVINKRIVEADLFVLVLHRRWGQQAPDSRYSSYTEEEFRIALDRWKETQTPEIVVFFKGVDAPSIADPGEQLKKVLAFKKELEEGRDVLFRPFQDERDFAMEVDRHLRAFARGEFERLDEHMTPIAIPAAIIDNLASATREGEALVSRAEERQRLVKSSVESARGELENATADLTLVRARQKNFALARAAVDAAVQNRIEDAKILFAQATEGSTELAILSTAAEFYFQINDSENASAIAQRLAAITGDRAAAARHYLRLLPEGFMASMMDDIVKQFATGSPPEAQDEMREVGQEIWGDGRLERLTVATLVYFYTEEEIVHLAKWLASSVGQSVLEKMRHVSLAMMQYGQAEVARVLLARHPEWSSQENQVLNDQQMVEAFPWLPSDQPKALTEPTGS